MRLAPITDRNTYTGRVEATSVVGIRARVTGFLDPLQFEEGGEVTAGTLLYEIEKAPYEAAVAEAEANLASANAALALARVNYERLSKLSANKAVSKSDRDAARAEMDQAKAQVMAREAALQRAQLDLGYTTISAPVDGRIGVSKFHPGELVGPDSGTLAVLVAQDPMLVAFPVPQRRFLEVRKAGKRPQDVVVRLQMPDGSVYEHPGNVLYADVQSNTGTDTITVRASFPNPERRLIDRQLVGVFVEDKNPVQRLVISQAALALDQQGAFVLVVDDSNTVQRRPIETGDQRKGLLTVRNGLTAGEQVIVSGQLKVRPGMQVAPEAADSTINADGKVQ